MPIYEINLAMKITKELLKRHSKGLCSEEERKAVEEWFKKIENHPKTDGPRANKDRIWAKLSQDDLPKTRINLNPRKKVTFFNTMTRYAAAVLILSVFGLSVYYVFNSTNWLHTNRQAALYHMVKTQRGEKRTLSLPDGSTIRMNYETQIKFSKPFEGDERLVHLIGQAHFDVARDETRPFIIYTEDTKTEVLGTSFDINTKPEEGTEIIVTSGEVAFSEKIQGDNRVMLAVNDRAVFRPDKSIVTDKVDASALTSWKENQLVFDSYTLSEVIDVLEPWYDVQVTVKNTDLMTRDFKLSMENPSLEAVMEALSFLGEFEYDIHEKRVTIY